MSTGAELLVRTERERLRALVEADIEAAQRVHAEDFQLITPSGVALSKTEYLNAVGSREINYLVWEPEEIVVRLEGSAAALRYRSLIEGIFNGTHIPRDCYWHTDVYERRDGLWQVVWSQATAISPPNDAY